jgi:hypothetical protein
VMNDAAPSPSGSDTVADVADVAEQ